MRKLRVGIAGYGVVGKRRHLNIDQHPNLQVVVMGYMFFVKNRLVEICRIWIVFLHAKQIILSLN